MFCCALLDSGSMFTFINITTTSNCEFNRIFIALYNEPVSFSFRNRYFVIKTGSLHQFNSRNNFFTYCLPMTFFAFVILAEYLESWSFGTNLFFVGLSDVLVVVFVVPHCEPHEYNAREHKGNSRTNQQKIYIFGTWNTKYKISHICFVFIFLRFCYIICSLQIFKLY